MTVYASMMRAEYGAHDGTAAVSRGSVAKTAPLILWCASLGRLTLPRVLSAVSGWLFGSRVLLLNEIDFP